MPGRLCGHRSAFINLRQKTSPPRPFGCCTMPTIVLAADGPTQIGLRARERRGRWLRAHSARLLSHSHPIARIVACVSRLDTLSGSSHACSSESPPACHIPCVPTLRRTSASHIPHLTVHCTTPCPRLTLPMEGHTQPGPTSHGPDLCHPCPSHRPGPGSPLLQPRTPSSPRRASRSPSSSTHHTTSPPSRLLPPPMYLPPPTSHLLAPDS